MEVLVAHARENRLSMEEIPEPKIGQNSYAPYDIILEIKYAGICGSDIRARKGLMKRYGVSHDTHLPSGHEFSGVVKAVGDKVKGLKVGDRVTGEEHVMACGDCILCRSGNSYLCKEVEALPNGRHPPEGGIFRKYAPFPARFLHKIPDNISLEEGALTEPASVPTHALLERGDMSAGESVAVLGPGPIGLLGIQAAKAAGAGLVVSTGLTIDEELRLKTARELGADVTINIEKKNPVDVVSELTGGIGADIVLDATGSPTGEAVKQGLEIVRPGGRLVVVGQGYPSVELDIVSSLIKREVDIRGSLAATYVTFELVSKLMSQGKIRAKPLITKIMPMSEWEKAFELAEQRNRHIKILLQP